MKDIAPLKGKYYIQDLIAQGEHVSQDFKFLISDARKIARSISAFANNMGGRLLIGVKDNGIAAGVRNDEDIYVVEQAATQFCRPAQQVEFTAFNVGAGVTVIRASVPRSASRPVMALDTDRRWKAYFRVHDENILAHPLMVRAWRKASSDTGSGLFSLSSVESSFLDLLDGSDTPPDPRTVAIALHIPSATADSLIVRLAALGIIEFCYAGNGQFLIRRTPQL